MDIATSHDRAREVLRTHRMRATNQRTVVLGALMRDAGDTTPQALYDRLAPDHPTLGLATVYRTLGSLSAAGVIDSMHHGHGTCYRWCTPGHHHHLTCTACHQVVEVRDCGLHEWADNVAAAHGFSDVRHTVELAGLCGECQSKHDGTT